MALRSGAGLTAARPTPLGAAAQRPKVGQKGGRPALRLPPHAALFDRVCYAVWPFWAAKLISKYRTYVARRAVT